ncbi:MAG: peptide ABC transporter substrate-binding protein [Clostridiaceae bacterium]|jgi:ABC-type oligopeptide transport system substrate-binding subunit|nr:peptide ABC transporter substrate-binding protein [Clostridiaceae bacterium]
MKSGYWKKLLALVLASVLLFGVAACKPDKPAEPSKEQTKASEPEGSDPVESDPVEPVETAPDDDTLMAIKLGEVTEPENHIANCDAIYDAQLGEYLEYYEKALEEDDLNLRWALQAIAEAKFLESGVILPATTQGGTNSISRVVPYSTYFALWGNDADKVHTALVATELIKKEDREALKAMWNDLKGTGTYYEEAKKFMADKGYELKDEWTYFYTSDPKTWDYLATYYSADSEAILLTIDGLYSYDQEGVLQPSLATDYEVSDDGLKYTFKLREGVKWVDSQGREVAEMVADDFVAAMQHLLDAKGGLEYLVTSAGAGILNAEEYLAGEVTDFDEVGVKALDEYTLEYTLTKPCSFFMSMLSYNVFAPMCRTYYDSMGGVFGSDFEDVKAEDSYKYGKSPDAIAYIGPYLVTNSTAETKIVFEANPNYWNKDAVTIKKNTWLFNDGSDPMKPYNDCMAGVVDGCGLNPSSYEVAKGDGNFEKYGYVSGTTAVTFSIFFNLNRNAFMNSNDATKCVSTQTVTDAWRTHRAINNKHFRLAFMYSLDRATYNAQTVGEDVKFNSLRNSYVPWNFVSLDEDVVVDINGTETNFPAGTWYGEIVQAQLDADGYPIVVYNPEADNGLGSGDGYDGWFNPDAAVEELNIAIDELAKVGVEISKENPIKIDYPYPKASESFSKKANALKQSVEGVLDGKVVFNLVPAEDFIEWYYTSYYAATGYEKNYDISDASGWGPDYGDPATYLNTYLPGGDMVNGIGLD